MVEEEAPVSKTVKLIIALAAVAVVIGAYFIIKNLPDRSQPVTTTDDRIYHLRTESSNLARMEFRRPGGEMIVLESEEKEVEGDTEIVWSIVHPEVSFDIRDRSIRDIAFALARVFSEKLIEENPGQEELELYGLDNPTAYATLETRDGEKLEVTVGSKTPTGVAYYMQKNGEPEVYTLRKYTVDKFMTELVDFRIRDIPVPDSQRSPLTYFRLAGSERETIEVVPREEDDVFVGAMLSSVKLAKPYKLEYAVNTQRFQEMIERIPRQLRIERFIDDDSADLSQYGLDSPRYEIEMRNEESSLHLLLGDEYNDEEVYAKKAGVPGVFTLSNRSLSFIQTDAFTLVDKFIMLVNIQNVRRLTIMDNEEGTAYTAEIKRETIDSGSEEEEVEETYFINDTEIDEDPFKKFYQKVIGILADAENPDPQPLQDPEVSIRFEFNENIPTDTAAVDFEEINRDFYAAYRNGVTEFLASDYQVEAIFTTAESALNAKDNES